MALTGEEIRARLSAFAARWDGYAGSERSGGQVEVTRDAAFLVTE